jgi:hypothetical protein
VHDDIPPTGCRRAALTGDDTGPGIDGSEHRPRWRKRSSAGTPGRTGRHDPCADAEEARGQRGQAAVGRGRSPGPALEQVQPAAVMSRAVFAGQPLGAASRDLARTAAGPTLPRVRSSAAGRRGRRADLGRRCRPR